MQYLSSGSAFFCRSASRRSKRLKFLPSSLTDRYSKNLLSNGHLILPCLRRDDAQNLQIEWPHFKNRGSFSSLSNFIVQIWQLSSVSCSFIIFLTLPVILGAISISRFSDSDIWARSESTS